MPWLKTLDNVNADVDKSLLFMALLLTDLLAELLSKVVNFARQERFKDSTVLREDMACSS